jgi:PAS domain S-box-containing protein
MTIPGERSSGNQSKDNLYESYQFDEDYIKKTYGDGPIGILVINANAVVVYANNVALSYANLQKNEILGQSVFGLYEDIFADKANEARITRFEQIVDQEFKAKTQPGERWALISSKVHHDPKAGPQTHLFIRDISKQKKKEKLFSYLNQAATALAKTRNTKSALEQIAQFIVPKFANWFTIDKLTENGLELLLLKHEDPARIEWAYQYRKNYPADLNSNAGPALVLKTGKPGFVPVVTEDMINALITDPLQREEVKKIGLHSVIITPIYTNDKITGLVNFISSAPDRHFDENDLDFAGHFATLIGLALENARLNEEAANEILLRKESEERFQFLTDAIPHKLWTSGPDGRATYYNQQWYDYTRVKGLEALREKIWDFIHPDDHAVAAVEWPKAVQNGESMELEHRLMRYDGVYRWHLSRFTAHKNDDGQIVLWVGTSTDIHEQKISGIELAAVNEELAATNEEFIATNEELTAANEELAATNEELAATNEELAATNEELTEIQANLQRSEKLFRSIALNIPKSLIIVIDKSHRYVTIEGDIMEKMGYNRNDYEGKHPATISPERYEASKHLYERVMAGEKFSVERKAETGESFVVYFVPLKNGYNEVEAGLIIALDISDIKQAEEKSAKLAAIVESSDDAIISKTLESVITSWNDSAERMFGYTADEIIGQTIYKIIPPDRQDEEPRILSSLKNGERVEHFETKRVTKDGRLLDVSLTISPVRDARGNVIGLSKIARDITEKKQEEQRKIDFIGMVSHELKTPLTSLNAIMQVASAKLKKSDNLFLASAVERANVQVKRMTGMVNGFLNISRLEAGKMHIEKEQFDLVELLSEILAEIRLTLSIHTITFVECKPVQINADRDKIGSVISNLIGNAIKYSPNGKQIEINCQIRGAAAMVSVKDEGMGIEPPDLEQIFDRYYRVEKDHTRHIAGFGIGLYLSAEIIRQHDGNIWAESEIGKGSTFYFTLPLTDN